MNVFAFFHELGFSGVLDILLLALLLYAVLVLFKRSRSSFVLTGILIFSGLYLLARYFNLVLVSAVFDKFFAVLLIALVIIFQEEIRHFFEQIAVWSLNRRLPGLRSLRQALPETTVLVRTVTDLARERIGALIVLTGRDLLLRHLDGGVALHGELSEPLLKSVFDPHSVGHDGAVVIEGNLVTQFSAHLPLSKRVEQIGPGGTRHAAALGLSELTDALCLVVSEERGTISVARRGRLQAVTGPEKLTALLEQFYAEVRPQTPDKWWQDFFKQNSWEKLIALLLSLALWFVLVHGANLTYKSYRVPVTYAQPAAPWRVTELSPPAVHVTFRGPRRAFYFVSPDDIKLFLRLPPAEGSQTVVLASSDFDFPKSLVMENIWPHDVTYRMKKQAPTAAPRSPAGLGFLTPTLSGKERKP